MQSMDACHLGNGAGKVLLTERLGNAGPLASCRKFSIASSKQDSARAPSAVLASKGRNYLLFRASLQRPSFQYMNVPQLPGDFAEAILAEALPRLIPAFPDFRLGPASAGSAGVVADLAPLASASGTGLRVIAKKAAADNITRLERIVFLLGFPAPSNVRLHTRLQMYCV